MRITNTMMSNSFLSSLNGSMEKMNKYQNELATNKRINRLSDDPIGAITIMQAKVKLSSIAQYQKNIDTARTATTQSETSVMELNELVKDAYESAVDAASGAKTVTDQQSIAAKIAQLRDQAMVIGNNKTGDKYIFGGYNTTKAPFSLDSSTGVIQYNGLNLEDATNPALIAQTTQAGEYEIGFGLKVKTSVPGTSLLGMGTDNVYSVLDGLYKTLMAGGSSDEIMTYASKLQNNQSNLLSLDAEIGGTTNRLDLVANRFEQDTLNYTEMRSNSEDIDQSEVITQYKLSESVYTAALKVGADIIQPTLVDFIR